MYVAVCECIDHGACACVAILRTYSALTVMPTSARSVAISSSRAAAVASPSSKINFKVFFLRSQSWKRETCVSACSFETAAKSTDLVARACRRMSKQASEKDLGKHHEQSLMRETGSYLCPGLSSFTTQKCHGYDNGMTSIRSRSPFNIQSQ